jgi:hypothetical protein
MAQPPKQRILVQRGRDRQLALNVEVVRDV